MIVWNIRNPSMICWGLRNLTISIRTTFRFKRRESHFHTKLIIRILVRELMKMTIMIDAKRLMITWITQSLNLTSRKRLIILRMKSFPCQIRPKSASTANRVWPVCKNPIPTQKKMTSIWSLWQIRTRGCPWSLRTRSRRDKLSFWGKVCRIYSIMFRKCSKM